jgi:diadenosine tetraphosphate (Ap4A) HIT family hydrolase
MSEPFALDPRLAADTRAVISLPLCDVRLMDDARYAWLVLVPRRADIAEVNELASDDQARLWREVASAASALRAAAPCDKINIGALGNIVRQLHVHVVARRVGDAAWPGPVWGHGRSVAYDDDRAAALIAALRHALAG